jgi:hypothetical protein
MISYIEQEKENIQRLEKEKRALKEGLHSIFNEDPGQPISRDGAFLKASIYFISINALSTMAEFIFASLTKEKENDPSNTQFSYATLAFCNVAGLAISLCTCLRQYNKSMFRTERAEDVKQALKVVDHNINITSMRYASAVSAYPPAYESINQVPHAL